MLGIDRVDLAFEPGVQKVVKYDLTDSAGFVRCANHGDRARRKQLVKIQGAHGGYLLFAVSRDTSPSPQRILA